MDHSKVVIYPNFFQRAKRLTTEFVKRDEALMHVDDTHGVYYDGGHTQRVVWYDLHEMHSEGV